MVNGIKVRIKKGYVMDGKGEGLGTDSNGQSHTFWRMSGDMEIPIDLAIKLELERPQRFEIVDREFVKSLGVKLPKEEIKKVNKLVKIKPTTIKVVTPISKPIITPVEIPKPIKINKNVKFKDTPLDELTIEKIKSSTKDELNDLGAVNNISLNTKDNKGKMIKQLIKGVENILGFKLKKK